MFIQPHEPDYVPEPMYPEYIPLEDEHVLPAEEQPLPPIDSPTAESPGYVAESDPKVDPEEYEDDETEDGPVDYPMDGGDDGDDDDGESSGEDADDEDEDEEDEEEEEEDEHLAPVDSAIIIPIVKLVSPPEGTEPVIPPPFTDTTTTGARITVWLQDAISLPPKAEVERLLAMLTPPPSPLASLSPPSVEEHLARMASTQAHIDAITTALPSPPTLYIPPPIDRSDDIPETEMPPRKSLCLSTLGSRYEIGESSTARSTGGEVNNRVTELAKLHEHDTQDLYDLLEDAQYSRMHISQPVTMDSQRVDLLMEDRIAHQETILIVEEKAYTQQAEIADLRETDRRRQAQMVETLRVMGDMRREMGDMQAKLLALREQPRRARQPEEDARIEKVESVFQISGCAIENQVKFTTCTLLDAALTWWNSQIRSLGPDAYSMTWEASKSKMLDETIELANDLMDQKHRTYAERQTNNKRKADDSFRNNHGHQQQPAKRQNVTKVYNMGSGHFARDCKSSGNTNIANGQRDNTANPKGNGCFECVAPRNFKIDYLKLKNKDGGNVNAQGWVYAVRNAEKKGNASRDPDSNVITGTFLLNNRYATILFNTGANRSFISTAFSSLIDIVPTPLGKSYDVELADGKIVGVETIMRGCTLNFLNYPFNIDLMPVDPGSFDVLIGMDWLRRCHAVIVCDEKLVRVPYGDETLIFHGDKSNNGRYSRLTIISCLKAQEYMAKGCQIFLA
nr:hypothetical protein [Tanacetum cinerariifolium]